MTTIRILRSETADAPNTLPDGVLAYSYGNDSLYIGDANDAPILVNPKPDNEIANAAYDTAREAYNRANSAYDLAAQAYDAAQQGGGDPWPMYITLDFVFTPYGDRYAAGQIKDGDTVRHVITDGYYNPQGEYHSWSLYSYAFITDKACTVDINTDYRSYWRSDRIGGIIGDFRDDQEQGISVQPWMINPPEPHTDKSYGYVFDNELGVQLEQDIFHTGQSVTAVIKSLDDDGYPTYARLTLTLKRTGMYQPA